MDITSTGGTVSTSDGTSVVIPADALSTSTAISVGSESNTVSVAGVTLVGTVYRFGPEGTQFAKPVTVTLAFDPSKLPSADTSANIVIMTAPVGSSSFTPLATTVVDASHVSATTAHFSDFVATVPTGDTDLSVPPIDLTVAVDLAQHNPDLAVNDDMANACGFTYNDSTCTLTGCTIGAQPQAYSLNCLQPARATASARTWAACSSPSPRHTRTRPHAQAKPSWR